LTFKTTGVGLVSNPTPTLHQTSMFFEAERGFYRIITLKLAGVGLV